MVFHTSTGGVIFEFDLPKRPTTTSQQKGVSFRGGKPHFYEKSKVKSQRALYAAEIRSAFARAGLPIPYFKAEVAASITFCFENKTKRLWGRYKPTKPDVDNSVKLLLDVLGELHFWRDDAQVCVLTVEKFYSEKSSIRIQLEDIKNDRV